MKRLLGLLVSGAVVLLAGGAAALVASEEPAEAAFPGERNGLIAFSDGDLYDGDGFDYDQLFVMGPDGSGRRQLPAGDRGVFSDEYALSPQWSPNGRHILFEYRSNDVFPYSEVYVARADGTGVQAIVDTSDVYEQDPQWFPSGRKIVYCSAPMEDGEDGPYDFAEDMEIYSLLLDRDKRPVGSPVRLTNNDVNDCPTSVSPDGTKLVFARGGVDLGNSYSGGGVYVMGANRREGPANPAVRLADNGSQADFSPSGEKLLYTGRGNGGALDIFVINADGTGKTNLTHSARAIDTSPAWSPDGKEIAFYRARRLEDKPTGGQQWDNTIWKMRADGTGRVRLTTVDPIIGYTGTKAGLDWQPIP